MFLFVRRRTRNPAIVVHRRHTIYKFYVTVKKKPRTHKRVYLRYADGGGGGDKCTKIVIMYRPATVYKPLRRRTRSRSTVKRGEKSNIQSKLYQSTKRTVRATTAALELNDKFELNVSRSKSSKF